MLHGSGMHDVGEMGASKRRSLGSLTVSTAREEDGTELTSQSGRSMFIQYDSSMQSVDQSGVSFYWRRCAGVAFICLVTTCVVVSHRLR